MRKLGRRILRRLCYEFRKKQHWFLYRYGLGKTLAPWRSAAYDLNDPARVFPGEPSCLPWASAEAATFWQGPSYVLSAEELLSHRLPILSREAHELSHGAATPSSQLRALAVELPAAIVASYHPIYWHTDFKVGYTWPKNVLFFDSRLAPRQGADVKIPWELSRFVHVGQLAHCAPEIGGHEFLMQVLDWITENPRFMGGNWSSELVVALRAINWIWGLQLFRPIANRYPRVKQCIAESLYDHFIYLQRNLAYHEIYSDDHYLGDLVGLIYICAAFPEFPDADRWLLFSILGMEEEMRRQVLDDGYSHMMSSHYHRFVAELFVSGAALLERLPSSRRERLNRIKPATAWPYVRYRQVRRFEVDGRLLSDEFYKKLGMMGMMTAALTKPNGLVPQLGDNDSARAHRFFDSIAADIRNHSLLVSSIALLTGAIAKEKTQADGTAEAELIVGGLPARRASVPLSSGFTDGLMHFLNAGIGVIRRGPFHLTVTCSPNGYRDGKGGHGHNDKLSFELNVSGTDFIVDGGCPYYTSEPELRNAFRSTRAHNTLVVGELEQDPLPADLFSLPQHCEISLERDGFWAFIGYHTGYGSPHRRRFEVFEDRVVIYDFLEISDERYLCFNLDPAVSIWAARGKEGGEIEVTLRGVNGSMLILKIIGVDSVQDRDGFFGVGFGQPVKNRMMRCHVVNTEIRTTLQYVELKDRLEK